MGKYTVKIEKGAQKDFDKIFKSGRKSDVLKIEKILIELTQNPYLGVGNPEQLKHELSGLWSRRINQKDRIVYEVKESIVTVFVLSAAGHYDDH